MSTPSNPTPPDEPPPISPQTPEPALPFARGELAAATLKRPHQLLELVLGERQRLAANLKQGVALPALVAALLTCSFLAALPFAIVDGWDRTGHVALLFLGSVLLCYPSLQVFGTYLGVRLHAAQYLAIALVIPSAAALFTLGFAPIYWFLAATMPDSNGAGLTLGIRITLLVIAMALALSHVNRLLLRDARVAQLRENILLWAGWQLLLVFLTWRMAETLGLLG